MPSVNCRRLCAGVNLRRCDFHRLGPHTVRQHDRYPLTAFDVIDVCDPRSRAAL
jgi:hypothetical protein